MSVNLIIGSSHALALAHAAGEIPAAAQDGLEGGLIALPSTGAGQNYLIYTQDRPHFLNISRGQRGEVVAQFSPFIEKIRQFNRQDCKVIFFIGGNEHNIHFLPAHPKPFDFIDPSSPAVEAGRQIIPRSVMLTMLRAALERPLLVTRVLASQVPEAQRFYVAPPPPIPSEAHIRGNPEIFDFGSQKIESAAVRLKIYRLYLEIVAGFCAEVGLTYLPPRSEGCDEQGFLAEPFWAGCTHATADYYRGLVTELGL